MSATRVGSAMTAFPHSIDVNEDVVTAQVMTDEHDCHHLPVTSEGAVVGVITDRDIQVAAALASGEPPATRVREVCHMPAFVVDADAPLGRTVAEMGERRISSAVVTRGGELVGILTATDVCRLFAQKLGA